MERKNKLIIAILIVAGIGILALAWGTFLGGPNLNDGNRTILVLGVDKGEQPGLGGLDMAFLIYMQNGEIKKYEPVYPGQMRHPTQPAPNNIYSGTMRLHDSLWSNHKEGTPEYDRDVRQGMEYAKETVAAETGVKADAVVAVTNVGLDAILDSIRPFKVNGEVSDLDSTSIIRENDNYSGYKGSSNSKGTMSRGDAVMVLIKAITQAATDPSKKNTMIKAALDEYNKGTIIMEPQGSFMGLLASKGLESLTS
ncbi:DUF4012 domain-containing protein [Methanobrevibacter sp. TMH8]|uniref:DUF4012 domain-containing protein n=1 Tax=Methanobrevibacter sp. TMH8 TaxID=2848611 RepID=UPI001CCE0C21|nr:DUF4012 domain-containing protein [Methanobrevibacter sp. TMH8]MBZ9571517.1 DUF4012 domain-containing protein [Methanobrevibacter sp. TMH8]